MDAQAGSIWHKIAGVATPRKSPRHGGGQPCLGLIKVTEVQMVFLIYCVGSIAVHLHIVILFFFFFLEIFKIFFRLLQGISTSPAIFSRGQKSQITFARKFKNSFSIQRFKIQTRVTCFSFTRKTPNHEVYIGYRIYCLMTFRKNICIFK